jgi:hypothetical protein
LVVSCPVIGSVAGPVTTAGGVGVDTNWARGALPGTSVARGAKVVSFPLAILFYFIYSRNCRMIRIETTMIALIVILALAYNIWYMIRANQDELKLERERNRLIEELVNKIHRNP